VVPRTAGHKYLKEHALGTKIINSDHLKEGKIRLWGGGFKIDSKKVQDQNGEFTKQSWITVTYTSRQLNEGGKDNMFVSDDIQAQFRQAMADLTGLPVYDSGVVPSSDTAPLTTPKLFY